MTANQEIDNIRSRAGGDIPQVLLQGLLVIKVVFVNLETLICNLRHPLALKTITQLAKHRYGSLSTNMDLQALRA